MRLPRKPVLTTGTGRIEEAADAVAASQMQMDALMWFEFLEIIRNQKVA